MARTTLLILLVVFFIAPVAAQPVPEPLQAWVDWVQWQPSHKQCPRRHNAADKLGKAARLCFWSQPLKLDLQTDGGAFDVQLRLFDADWVPLPGDEKNWPEQVQVNGVNAVVANRENKPFVRLQAGEHRIKGRFSWETMPQFLSVSDEYAHVDMTRFNQTQPFVQRSTDGSLWLMQTDETLNENERDALDVEVLRLISDGHPMKMLVQVRLHVSGRARNVDLGLLKTAQLDVLSIDSELPASVDSAGHLQARLMPGNYQLQVLMRVRGWPEALNFEPQGTHWPAQEVWAFEDNKRLRLTQISGVTTINPDQSESEWTDLPHYLVQAGDAFHIEEIKRGSFSRNEQYHLRRESWHAFEQNSVRTVDRIEGFHLGSWRLDAQPALDLLTVQSHGESLLVTRSTEGLKGVELKRPQIDVHAISEQAAQTQQPVTGWNLDFDTVHTTVHLPHGSLALATAGVDNAQGVWLEYWSIWSMFWVMLAVAVCQRLLGWRIAGVALVALVLGHFEAGFPLFNVYFLLVMLALVKLLHRGLLGQLTRGLLWLSVALFAFAAVPFLLNTAKLTAFPHLHYQGYGMQWTMAASPMADGLYSVEGEESDLDADVVKKSRNNYIDEHLQTQQFSNMEKSLQSPEERAQGKITVTGASFKQAQFLNNRYQSGANLQAGKGRPSWRGETVTLRWDNPVQAQQRHRLIVLTPFWHSVWRALAVVFFIGLSLRLLRAALQQRFDFSWQSKWAVFALFVLFMTPAWGQYPDEKLLETLQQRTTDAPVCDVDCASLQRMDMTLNGDRFEARLEYHVIQAVAVPLPRSEEWTLRRVEDAQGRALLLSGEHGESWVHLPAGIHAVHIHGQFSPLPMVFIGFPLDPSAAVVEGSGWTVAGLQHRRVLNQSLQLNRTAQSIDALASGSGAEMNTAINPVVMIDRRLYFDQNWTLQTHITRLAPENGAINVKVPLWTFENPTTELDVDANGAVNVSLADGQFGMHWTSAIERNKALTLQAQDSEELLESWSVLSAPQWHIDFDGVPNVIASDALDVDDYFLQQYLPRPGEQLQLRIEMPEAVSGEILAIQSVRVRHSVGQRIVKSSAEIAYRATQGGHLPLDFGADARINAIRYDGQEGLIVPESGAFNADVKPGTHRVQVEWQSARGGGFMTRAPAWLMDQPFTNLSTEMSLPGDEWLLHASGIGKGPVVLYWWSLLVFAALAWGLARVRTSPLKFHQWLILGAGLGVFSWYAFAVVAVWLLISGHLREGDGDFVQRLPVLSQWLLLSLTFFATLVLIGALAYGLLAEPDMAIEGNGSSAHQLRWFVDQGVAGALPQVAALTVPMWLFKALTLLWAVWLSASLLSWVLGILKSFDASRWWPPNKPAKKTAALDKE